MANKTVLIGGNIDGVKTVLSDDYLAFLAAQGFEIGAGVRTAEQAYTLVPLIHRCVELRANSISGLPFAVYNDSGEEAAQDWITALLLQKTEAALCLHGAAYWLILRNRTKRMLGVQWINPLTMSVNATASGIAGFQQRIGSQTIDFTSDEIVYFHTWSPGDDLGPGVAPVTVALSAAQLSHALQTFAATYFEHGAVPLVLLQVPAGTPQAEIDRLEAWWKKLLRGIRRAWETVAVRAGVEPKVIGQAVKDLAMPDLAREVRYQISLAFGVPETLIAEAANYAVAREHHIAFYTETVVPEARRLEATINQQLLSRLGLRFRFHPERLEIFQAQEWDKADRLARAVELGIITVDEARAQMDLPPLQKPQAVETGGDAESDRQRRVILDELRRWRDKAKRHGPEAEFKSDIIPPGLSGLVRAGLEAVGNDVFSFVKQASEPERDDTEQRVMLAVLATLRGLESRSVEAILEGDDGKLLQVLQQLREGLNTALTPEVTRIAYEEVLRQALGVGVYFDPAAINQAALSWASSYTYGLVSRLTDTTRDLLQEAITRFVATPGMTREQLEALLAPAFGDVRASMIAVTEVTRAYSAATSLYQKLLAEWGLQTRRVWHTRHDERVCPICGPLEGKSEDAWSDDLQGGPPAHVNCRCWTTLTVRRK